MSLNSFQTKKFFHAYRFKPTIFIQLFFIHHQLENTINSYKTYQFNMKILLYIILVKNINTKGIYFGYCIF